MLILLISELVIDTETSISIGVMIVMSILSIAIVYVLHFMILSVDYSRTEYVQFEDDEYYYYVKAVPKINVTTQNVKVKRINTAANNTNKNNKSLVRVKLKTGRHHQIRVQMSNIGHPLYGDIKYGSPHKDNLALQAYKLSFYQPVTRELLTFQKISYTGVFAIFK